MNNYPHSIRSLSPNTKINRGRVIAAIKRRYAQGPFRPGPRRSAWRHVHLAKDQNDLLWVWENGGGLTPGPSVLLEYLQQVDVTVTASEVNELHPGSPPTWFRRLWSGYYDLGPELQRSVFAQFLEGLPAWLNGRFPLERPDGVARIELVSSQVYVDELLFTSPRGYLRAQLQVVSREGGSARKSRVTLANFAVLNPDGTFNERGQPCVYAADEYVQELTHLFGFFLTELRERFAAVPPDAVERISISRLYSRED